MIGFIGLGNMATAMIGGILDKGEIKAEDIIASAKTEESRNRIKEKFGIKVIADNRKVAEADIVVLAVKPIIYEDVISEIKDVVRKDQIIVSIAPGKSLAWLQGQFGREIYKPDDMLKIVRAMPNTPALVGEGMTAFCCSERVSEGDESCVKGIFQAFGSAEQVPEHLMDAVVSVSGSSPAYVFMFIEAMADAAVAEGMPRAMAYHFAAQSVLGSAKMVLETGMHPAALKDMVCSPAGTTIEAVRVLEEKGMRSAVIEAMKACGEKCRE